MQANQKSIRDGIQDLLAPMSDLRITQGEDGIFSHRGSKAIDNASLKNFNLYAPCDCVCVAIDYKYAFVMWESLTKVRFASGVIDYACFYFGHDSRINATVGMIVQQGSLIAQEGTAGNVTGRHCHIEVAVGKYTGKMWTLNKYNIYTIPNAVSFEDAFFMDGTNITLGNANWRYTSDTPINKDNEIVNNTNKVQSLHLPATANSWRVYPLDKSPIVGNEIGRLNPSLFGGLTYDILSLKGNIAIIETQDFGKVQIFIGSNTGATIN